MSRLSLRHTLVAAAALLTLAGCEEEAPTASLDRETFIDTYVELRQAALQRGLSTVGDALRDSVLTRSGVTEDALVEFAEVHGSDLEFMRDVWTEVAARLDSIPFDYVGSGVDSTAGSEVAEDVDSGVSPSGD